MATEFPLDWDDWRKEWHHWELDHPQLVRQRKVIPGKNFLADEIIGTFLLPSGRVAELSELTFPNLSDRDAATGRLIERTDRYIGVTFADDRSGTVVGSFAELEAELGL